MSYQETIAVCSETHTETQTVAFIDVNLAMNKLCVGPECLSKSTALVVSGLHNNTAHTRSNIANVKLR